MSRERKLGLATVPTLHLPTPRPCFPWLVYATRLFFKVALKVCVFLKTLFLKQEDYLAGVESLWLALVVTAGRHAHMILGGYNS